MQSNEQVHSTLIQLCDFTFNSFYNYNEMDLLHQENDCI